MTRRLYYDDPSLTDFSARVVERLEWGRLPAVVLDRTAFYPTGGGQPHDTGFLGAVPVVEVVEREADSAVLHVMAGPVDADEVEGRVNWERRFDLMQQHTGQHILSAAFAEQVQANTVGFHLADEYATIDLDKAPISVEELARTEAVANAIVFANARILARFVADEEVPGLDLRKPLAHEGPVRIVEIDRSHLSATSLGSFDRSACGGTHVRAAGEVGLIKITRTERRGAETRVEFFCGGRALTDYQAKNALLMGLAQEFTVGYWELPDVVQRLTEELKESRRELRRSRDALLDVEATALWHQAEQHRLGSPALLASTQGQGPANCRVVKALFPGRSLDDLKHLAQRLIAYPSTVALLATQGPVGENSYFTFARSDDIEADLGALVRQACATIGGRGGGRPNFAQGGGPQGDMAAQALDQAAQSLIAALS
jgi:alanyl-tRNA synthetase